MSPLTLMIVLLAIASLAIVASPFLWAYSAAKNAAGIMAGKWSAIDKYGEVN